MWKPLLMTIRAFGQGPSSQVIVSAPPVAAGLGMSTFWIWHFMNSALRAFA
jgi:predicted DNA-binding transcriptional regulator AlpA